MVKKEWIQVKWFGLPSIRYLFLVLPSGQRVIVDHWSGFRLLHYFPFARKFQKYDAYFIPNSIDISDWEPLLVSEYDMIWRTAKIAGGNLIFKLLGGSAIGGIVIGLFELLENSLAELLKIFHIPPFIFILFFSFLMWSVVNVMGEKNIKKKIPLDQFEYKKKVINIQFKDFMMSATKYGYTIFIIFALIIVGTKFSSTMSIGMMILTFLAFLLNEGIVRTASLYINKNNLEEITNDK